MALLLTAPTALAQPGTVTGWGDNSQGNQATIPAGLADVVQISSLGTFSTALKTDGTVVAWGNNASGETNVPPSLANVTYIDSGMRHTLAILSDGSVTGFGQNGHGQLNVPAGLTAISVSAGRDHSVAVRTDGTVACWGRNVNGECNVPAGLSGVIAVDSGDRHNLALKADGTVVAWGGLNAFDEATVPAGLSGVVAIEAGWQYNLALKADGTVVAWGRGDDGQTTVPAGLTDVVGISAGQFASGAVKADGSVVVWGSNLTGQLSAPTLTNTSQIVMGLFHALALEGGPPNDPPTADAGPDLVLEATGPATTDVSLDGSGSSDPNGDALTYSWSVDGVEVATGVTPTVALPVGTTTVTLTVDDGEATDSDDVVVTLLYSTLAVSSPALYWPLDTAALSIDATDADGLYGLRVDLGFDTARLDYDAGSLAAGALFAGGSPQVAEQVFEADGRAELAAGRTDGAGATGSGSAATVTLSVVDHAAPGDADFTLTGTDAIDDAGAPFTFDAVTGGSFVVGGVWPGDLDNDCTVQAVDLFPIAFHYDETGPARQGPRDLSWGAKAFSPWGGSSASADFAQSFADADGNGEIDVADLFGILVNFGQTHDATTGCTPPAPLAGGATPAKAGSASAGSAPVTVQLGSEVGQLVAFEVAITDPATDLLGTASMMDHIATGATIVSVEPGELFEGAMSVVVLEDRPADVAFAHRGAGAAVSGAGPLFRVVARVDAPNATVELTELLLATVGEGTVVLDPASGGVSVSNASPVSNEGTTAAVAFGLAVAPNPARGATSLVLTAPEAGEVTVRVFDALGRTVSESASAVGAGTTSVSLDLSGLAPGAYVVRAEGAAGAATERLTVAR